MTASRSHLAPRRRATTARWPFAAAKWRGVQPNWGIKRKTSGGGYVTPDVNVNVQIDKELQDPLKTTLRGAMDGRAAVGGAPVDNCARGDEGGNDLDVAVGGGIEKGCFPLLMA